MIRQRNDRTYCAACPITHLGIWRKRYIGSLHHSTARQFVFFSNVFNWQTSPICNNVAETWNGYFFWTYPPILGLTYWLLLAHIETNGLFLAVLELLSWLQKCFKRLSDPDTMPITKQLSVRRVQKWLMQMEFKKKLNKFCVANQNVQCNGFRVRSSKQMAALWHLNGQIPTPGYGDGMLMWVEAKSHLL